MSTTPEFERAPGFTHIAIKVRDLEKSIAFYQTWCALKVVHRREDASPDHKGTVRVAWMGRTPDAAAALGGMPTDFWIVLLEAPRSAGPTSLFDHLGFDLASRAEVDALSARAQQAGVLHWPAEDMGNVVGYLCALKDPDGNVVEFSHGQTVRADRRKLDA